MSFKPRQQTEDEIGIIVGAGSMDEVRHQDQEAVKRRTDALIKKKFDEEAKRILDNERDRKEIPNKFLQYIDPVVNGISFSGSDIQATIYIPFSNEGRKEDETRIQKEINEAIEVLGELDKKYLQIVNSSHSEIAPEQRKLKVTEELRNYPFDKGVLLEQHIEKLKNELTFCMSGAIVRPIKLGTIQTVTTSIHRYKAPIRTLGSTYAKSYVRGTRTIAGTIVFTMFDDHALAEAMEMHYSYYNTGVRGSDGKYGESETLLIDQLPPFDMILTGSNELGANSYMVLYGVELVNEGITMSIQDLAIENVVQYIARDFDPWTKLNEKRTRFDRNGSKVDMTPRDLFKDSVLQRRKKKMNPFV